MDNKPTLMYKCAGHLTFYRDNHLTGHITNLHGSWHLRPGGMTKCPAGPALGVWSPRSPITRPGDFCIENLSEDVNCATDGLLPQLCSNLVNVVEYDFTKC